MEVGIPAQREVTWSRPTPRTRCFLDLLRSSSPTPRQRHAVGGVLTTSIPSSSMTPFAVETIASYSPTGSIRDLA